MWTRCFGNRLSTGLHDHSAPRNSVSTTSAAGWELHPPEGSDPGPPLEVEQPGADPSQEPPEASLLEEPLPAALAGSLAPEAASPLVSEAEAQPGPEALPGLLPEPVRPVGPPERVLRAEASLVPEQPGASQPLALPVEEASPLGAEPPVAFPSEGQETALGGGSRRTREKPEVA